MSDHPGKCLCPLDRASLFTLFPDVNEFNRGFDRAPEEPGVPAGDNPAGSEERGTPTGEEPGAPAGDISAGAEELGTPTGVEAPHHAQHDGIPFVERFPFGATGVLLPDMGQGVPVFEALRNDLGPDNIWHPFQSQSDWDFARWAKNRGPSSTAVTELLALDGVRTLQYDSK